MGETIVLVAIALSIFTVVELAVVFVKACREGYRDAKGDCHDDRA